MMQRSALLLILCGLVLWAPAQSLEFDGAEWEQKWIPQERLSYRQGSHDVRISYRMKVYDFFKTRSGATGEVLQSYIRVHYSAQADYRQYATYQVEIPVGSRLTNLDYRIWKDGLIIYEGKENSIANRISDTLIDPQTGDIRGLLMTFREVEPRSVLELYYRLEGIPMPYRLDFFEHLPVDSAVTAVRVSSNSPLHHWSSDSVIKFARHDTYEKEVYTYKVHGLEPHFYNNGMLVYGALPPYVLIDYQRPLPNWPLDESAQWSELMQYLLYQGRVRDLGRYHTILATHLGRDIYYTTLQNPSRNFREHPTPQIVENYSPGGYVYLDRSFTKRLYQLESAVDTIMNEMSHASLDSGLASIHRRVNRYVRNYMNDGYKKQFEHYNLLYSFYAQYLEKENAEYHPLFLKSPHRGGFEPNFVSIQQFDAQGITYKMPGGDWHFLIIGPHLGSFMAINELPPFLSGADGIVYKEEDDSLVKRKMPIIADSVNRVQRIRNIKLNFLNSRAYVRDTLNFRGAFRNRIFHGYLTGDTATDVFSATANTYNKNFYFTKDQHVREVESYNLDGDTLLIPLNLESALIMRKQPLRNQPLGLPISYQFQFRYHISADDTLKLKMKPLPNADAAAVSFSSELTKEQPDRYVLEVRFRLKKNIIPKSEVPEYRIIQNKLKSFHYIKIYRAADA